MALYTGTAPTIPDWLMLNSGKPSAAELERLRAPRVSIAARNTAVPILYGRERIDGRPFYAQVDKTNGFLYVGYLLCEGAIDSIEAVLMDGVDVTTGLLVRTGAAINRYLGGADNVVDPLLQAANVAVGLPAYTDTLPGTCYVVLKVPRGASSGFPRLEAIVKGRRVYDPRKDSTNGGNGTHRRTNPATWEWSDNPTLCFADFSTQLAGWDVVWPSIAENATYNDTLIEGSKKRTVGLLMQAQASASEWAQGFRVYMGAYLARENGAIRVVADRADVIPGTSQYNAAIAGTNLAALNAVGVAYHFRPDDIKAGTLSLKHRSQRNSPNSVIIEYTEARLVEGWRTETVQVDSPAIAAGAPRRNTKVSLVGIKDRSQAYREAVERLNWFQSDLEGSFTAWDEGLMVQVGSIIAISHPSPILMEAKLFRVVGHSFTNGRWSYNVAEYSPDMYSDVAVPPDGYVPPVPVDPTDIPDIVGLVAAEELFTYKDGTVRSRVRMAWSPDESPYLQGYQVEAWIGSQLLFQTFTKVNVATTDAIEELNAGAPTDVLVKVAAVYRSGMGRYTQMTTPVRGKQTPPPAIITAVASAGNEQVTLDWQFPSQEKMLGTEVWVSTVNNLGDAVKKGTVPYPQNNATLTGLAPDVPVYIWLRLVDQVGNLGAYYPTSSTGGLSATPTKSAVGQELADEIAARMAADAAEALARANAIEAEAQARANAITTLSDTVNQNALDAAAALLAQKSDLEVLISTQVTTLTNADIMLGQRIDAISAGSNQMFDPFQQWSFDAGVEGWVGMQGTPSVSSGWLRPVDNPTNTGLVSPDALGMSGSQYPSVMMRLRKTGTVPWIGQLQWITDADPTWDSTKSITVPAPTFNSDGVALLTIPDLTWGAGSPIKQVRLIMTGAQTSTNFIEYDWVALGRVSPGASVAALQREEQARVDGDTAQATARETLAAQMRGTYEGTDIEQVTTGLLFSERQARVSAVEAVASNVTSLQVSLGRIGGDNLLSNSSFEVRASDSVAPTGWTVAGVLAGSSVLSYVDSPLPGSTKAFRIQFTAGTAAQFVALQPENSDTGRPKVAANQNHVLSGHIRFNVGQPFYVRVAYFGPSGQISFFSLPDTIATGDWQRFVYDLGVAPATATSVLLSFIARGTPQSTPLTIDLDNMQLQQGAVATQWAPSGSEVTTVAQQTATAVTGLTTRVNGAESNIVSLANQFTTLTATVEGLGGTNLLSNSSFDQYSSPTSIPTGWLTEGTLPTYGAISYVDGTLPGSAKAFRIDATPPSTSEYFSLETSALEEGRFKVSGTQKYTLSAYHRTGGDAVLTARMWWYNAAGVMIETSVMPYIYVTDQQWHRYVFTATAPATAVSVFVEPCTLFAVNGGSPLWLELDNAQFQKGDNATPWGLSDTDIAASLSANATAINGMQASVTSLEGVVTSLSTATTNVQAQIGNTTGYRVISRGTASVSGGAPADSGVYNTTGTKIRTFTRGINVVALNNDGTLGLLQTFDVLGNPTTGAQAAADYISALPENQYFVVAVHDNVGPLQANNAANNLLRTVLLDFGASTTTYTQVQDYRAYILIGRRKLGAGAGIELICAPVDSAPDGQWTEYTLQTLNGVPVGMTTNREVLKGINATASGLTDLSARVTAAEGTITSVANSITSLNASIGGILSASPNLLLNPTFALDKNSWTAPASTATYHEAPHGDFIFVPATPSTSLVIEQTVTALQPGTYTVSADYFRNGITGSIRLEIAADDGSGQIANNVVQAEGSPTQTWKRLSVTLVAPTGTTALRVRLVSQNAQDGASFRRVKLERAATASPFSDDKAGYANAQALSTLSASVSNIDGRVTSQASQITSLSASIAGKAEASIVQTMQVQVNNAEYGGNLLRNATFAGWQRQGWGWLSNGQGWSELGNPTGDNGWTPPGTYGLGSVKPGNLANDAGDYFATDYFIPVEAGKTYSFSYYVACHRCKIFLYIAWINQSGNEFATSSCPEVSQWAPNPVTLDSLQRPGVIAVAPAGAVSARIIGLVRGIGQDTPYWWIYRPMFCRVGANTTVTPPWSAGGTETNAEWSLTTNVNGYISGLLLKNNGSTSNFRVLADKFEIVSPNGGQRTEYSGGNWRVYDGNGVLRVQMGVW